MSGRGRERSASRASLRTWLSLVNPALRPGRNHHQSPLTLNPRALFVPAVVHADTPIRPYADMPTRSSFPSHPSSRFGVRIDNRFDLLLREESDISQIPRNQLCLARRLQHRATLGGTRRPEFWLRDVVGGDIRNCRVYSRQNTDDDYFKEKACLAHRCSKTTA
jgi:hypothetical protein